MGVGEYDPSSDRDDLDRALLDTAMTAVHAAVGDRTSFHGSALIWEPGLIAFTLSR